MKQETHNYPKQETDELTKLCINIAAHCNDGGIEEWAALLDSLNLTYRRTNGNLYLPCFNCDFGERYFKVQWYFKDKQGMLRPYPLWGCYSCKVHQNKDRKNNPDNPVYHPSFIYYIREMLGPDANDSLGRKRFPLTLAAELMEWVRTRQRRTPPKQSIKNWEPPVPLNKESADVPF